MWRHAIARLPGGGGRGWRVGQAQRGVVNAAQERAASDAYGARLEVAVDHATLVQIAHGFAELLHHGPRARQRQRAGGGQAFQERPAVQNLHDQEHLHRRRGRRPPPSLTARSRSRGRQRAAAPSPSAPAIGLGPPYALRRVVEIKEADHVGVLEQAQARHLVAAQVDFVLRQT